MSKAAVSRPRVYVRIRPLNAREEREGKGELICRGDARQQDVLYVKKDEGNPELQVRFDHIFDRSVSQHDVYTFVSPEVQRALFSGYNASIFAYGQTGSGKTHTMEGAKTAEGVSAVTTGDTENYGLIPRLIEGIFLQISQNKDITGAVVEVSLVQIYQEKIQDLLNQRKQLEIHMDRTGQYVARDATWKKVTNTQDSMRLYAEASKMRATSSTEMNLVSSRSHMILMMRMQWDEPTLPGSHAQLNLVDLAGSERLNESGAKGETMMEAIHINKSLSALGSVVIKLVEQAKHQGRRIHIPYKDSKLTYLLQSSLGGANLMHFMLAVSASAMWRNETNSTIEFGKRALQLVLRPVRNAIDYTRLAEMEAMIEHMRTHIQSLEEELQNKKSIEAAGFLQIQQIPQTDDDDRKRQRGERRKSKKHLKRETELMRIMANLPETFDDLTSHCVLFPESKTAFREIGGLEKLVHFVDKSVSSYYRSNAAQTIAIVIDDVGRDLFVEMGGMDALTRLLQVKEERCKEAACVALEAVCRGHRKNKDALGMAVYEELVDLIYGYPNQQVQEAACTTIASIVDGYVDATRRFGELDVVPKLLETIRITPEEVVNLTKAATNCVGRLAHGDVPMQQLIASLGGIDLLIDVLFSPAGDRDHQIPILASYALVNLCCSSVENLEAAKEDPRYAEVKFRLLEGLARAFGSNTAREGFGRATAQESASPFPYYGVTVLDKWTLSTSGGRPIFSTFMDNPQFNLLVTEVADIAFIIQDRLYETRMRKKRRNNAVYMGLAIFEGDADLSKEGLKQLDFHGKIVEIGKYTSNCENVLHCRLPPSDTPYMVVPFTSQKGRQTEFALSAFSDKPIELTAVPDQLGWVRSVLDGCWTEFTGRSGESFDWRCNPQVRLTPRDDCRVVFVLSYLSLDRQRAALSQDDDDEEFNQRPRLHGRLFTSEFAPAKRYLKALVPLPQGSTFAGSNAFASKSYITTTAVLTRDMPYVFIPFTEIPYQDSFRVSVYCDSDNVQIEPLASQESEWLCTSLSGTWAGNVHPRAERGR
ncbi:kinesin [Strigomonas culicis]|uniref:Kinesin n=1 Tax=Strigomonas culicis TaxID=28005 RepID=S9TU63_9TRYP|nr:kinesin [Strigomonas culicis]|eukprot:EPY20063.1 kinesin [Strigomonas culicis]